MKIYQKLKGLFRKPIKTVLAEYEIFDVVYVHQEAAEIMYDSLMSNAETVGHTTVGYYRNLLEYAPIRVLPTDMPDPVISERYGWTLDQLTNYMTIQILKDGGCKLILPVPRTID